MTTGKVNKKRLSGVVVKVKTPMSPIVEITTKFAHPKYKKIVHEKKRYMVHSEREVEVGTKVTIEAIKPKSKNKRWRIVKTNK